MKAPTHTILFRATKRWLLTLATVLLCLPKAHADLGFNMDIYKSLDPNSGQTNWYVWTSLSTTNSIATYYQLYSTQSNILSGLNGGTTSTIYFSDLSSTLNEITNGNWTLILNVGDPSQQTYTFHVTANGLSSADIPTFQILSPAYHGSISNSSIEYVWSGPTNWNTVNVNVHNNNYNFYQASTLAGNVTNWDGNIPLDLTYFDYTFNLDVATNVSPHFTVSTPLTSGSQPLAGWSAIETLHFDENLDFYLNYTFAYLGHQLIAHYTFDDSGYLGQDTSGNGNDVNGASWWGSPVHQASTDAKVGGGSVQFYGVSSMTPYGQSFGSWSSALSGSFSASAWVKTTATTGNDSDDAISGAAIFWAYNDQGGTNDAIPLAITGSKAAFTTRDHLGNSTSVHSVTSVNDDNYHLITVTRDASTGVMTIYVDGNFEAVGTGTTDPLNGNNYYLSIGGTYLSSYTGVLDDVQFYTGVLSASEVSYLYNNPGTAVADVVGGSNNGLVVHYDLDEGTVLAPDVSGNGNNIVYTGNFGGSGPSIDADAIAGAGSMSFDGGSYATASPNILATLAGSFSLSLWVKTTQDNGDPGDLAWTGDCIISADIPTAGANDLIPVALTGGQIAFNTANTQYNSDDTINSTALVNDGQWHHVVVSRNQPTGDKFIYIDGVLDTSDTDATNLLNDPQLLTIGCKSDASDPDPSSPDYNGSNGYDGQVDDIQIYNRVLSSNEVAFLHQNPGVTIGGAAVIPYPVDVSLQFVINRSQDPNWGEIYGGGVSFNSVSPDPTTTNSVHSPHDYFSTETYPGGGSGSGAILSSLDQVINEFTNGLWKIYINEGSPTQQVYSFQISISGLDTNVLPAVRILSPVNGAVNVRSNAAFYWTGPTNFSSLHLDLAGVANYLSLPLNTTNWSAGTALSNGNQFFDLNYNSNNFPGITFSTPVDASTNAVRTWSTGVTLTSQAFSLFFVGPNPVVLAQPGIVGANFQFAFQSQTGVTNTVLYRTNLVSGNWQTWTNITGDGSLKTIPIPVSAFNGSKQGFVRILSK